MLYVIEEVDVASSDLPAYLQGLDELWRPRLADHGMELVSCWHTAPGIGLDVRVTTVCTVPDWGAWDAARQKAILDPASPAWWELRGRLIRWGHRRFATPAAFSPLK